MASLVKIAWRPDRRGLRRFGAVVALGSGLVGAALLLGWPLGPSPRAAVAVWIAGGVIGGLGLTGTRAGLPGYWAWMGTGWILGNVTSRIVLALVYYLVVTPLGIGMRLTGRDRLGLRRSRGGSLWRDLEDDGVRSGHERQF